LLIEAFEVLLEFLMDLRFYEVFQSALELIDLVMQLRICLNQVFHGLFILFSGLIGIIEVLVENILA